MVAKYRLPAYLADLAHTNSAKFLEIFLRSGVATADDVLLCAKNPAECAKFILASAEVVMNKKTTIELLSGYGGKSVENAAAEKTRPGPKFAEAHDALRGDEEDYMEQVNRDTERIRSNNPFMIVQRDFCARKNAHIAAHYQHIQRTASDYSALENAKYETGLSNVAVDDESGSESDEEVNRDIIAAAPWIRGGRTFGNLQQPKPGTFQKALEENEFSSLPPSKKPLPDAMKKEAEKRLIRLQDSLLRQRKRFADMASKSADQEEEGDDDHTESKAKKKSKKNEAPADQEEEGEDDLKKKKAKKKSKSKVAAAEEALAQAIKALEDAEAETSGQQDEDPLTPDAGPASSNKENKKKKRKRVAALMAAEKEKKDAEKLASDASAKYAKLSCDLNNDSSSDDCHGSSASTPTKKKSSKMTAKKPTKSRVKATAPAANAAKKKEKMYSINGVLHYLRDGHWVADDTSHCLRLREQPPSSSPTSGCYQAAFDKQLAAVVSTPDKDIPETLKTARSFKLMFLRNLRSGITQNLHASWLHFRTRSGRDMVFVSKADYDAFYKKGSQPPPAKKSKSSPKETCGVARSSSSSSPSVVAKGGGTATGSECSTIPVDISMDDAASSIASIEVNPALGDTLLGIGDTIVSKSACHSCYRIRNCSTLIGCAKCKMDSNLCAQCAVVTVKWAVARDILWDVLEDEASSPAMKCLDSWDLSREHASAILEILAQKHPGVLTRLGGLERMKNPTTSARSVGSLCCGNCGCSFVGDGAFTFLPQEHKVLLTQVGQMYTDSGYDSPFLRTKCGDIAFYLASSDEKWMAWRKSSEKKAEADARSTEAVLQSSFPDPAAQPLPKEQPAPTSAQLQAALKAVMELAASTQPKDHVGEGSSTPTSAQLEAALKAVSKLAARGMPKDHMQGQGSSTMASDQLQEGNPSPTPTQLAAQKAAEELMLELGAQTEPSDKAQQEKEMEANPSPDEMPAPPAAEDVGAPTEPSDKAQQEKEMEANPSPDEMPAPPAAEDVGAQAGEPSDKAQQEKEMEANPSPDEMAAPPAAEELGAQAGEPSDKAQQEKEMEEANPSPDEMAALTAAEELAAHARFSGKPQKKREAAPTSAQLASQLLAAQAAGAAAKLSVGKSARVTRSLEQIAAEERARRVSSSTKAMAAEAAKENDVPAPPPPRGAAPVPVTRASASRKSASKH